MSQFKHALFAVRVGRWCGRIQLAVPGIYTISAVWNLEAVYTGGFQVILLAFPRVGAEKK